MDEKDVAPKDARPQKKQAGAAKPAPAPAHEKVDPADQPFIRAEND